MASPAQTLCDHLFSSTVLVREVSLEEESKTQPVYLVKKEVNPNNPIPTLRRSTPSLFPGTRIARKSPTSPRCGAGSHRGHTSRPQLQFRGEIQTPTLTSQPTLPQPRSLSSPSHDSTPSPLPRPHFPPDSRARPSLSTHSSTPPNTFPLHGRLPRLQPRGWAQAYGANTSSVAPHANPGSAERSPPH